MSEEQSTSDQTATTSLDTSSAENFMQSLIEMRKVSHPEESFTISGNIVFEDGAFRVVTFTEVFEPYSYEYSIVLNPANVVTIENPDKDTYIEVKELLAGQNIKASLYHGILKPLEFDFTGDGFNDFQLSVNPDFHSEVNTTNTIILYKGGRNLETTGIMAKSSYSSGESDEEFNGFKEVMEFKPVRNALPKIILTHDEGGFVGPDGGLLGKFSYQLTWQWSENKAEWGSAEWVTGFIGNYAKCQPVVDEFTRKRMVLSDKYEGYAMEENCQNGGVNFFQLKPFESKQSDCYKWVDNEDDVGYYLLAYIFEREHDYVMLFTRYEKFEANISGAPEVGRTMLVHYVSKRDAGSDLESHWGTENGSMALYTVEPEKYTTIPCYQNN